MSFHLRVKTFLRANDVHFRPTAGSRLHQSILEGFESLYKYIHSGEIEELNDVIPHEDFTDYTAEDFIQDHAIVTDGDEKDKLADPAQNDLDDEEEDAEPRSKRFRGDYDSYDEGSNDSRYNNNNAPGIPSLLNLNLARPRHGQESESSKSPTAVTPWEASNQNSKSSGNHKDRREGRRSSRWR